MALVGALSLMLLHEQFVANPRPGRAVDADAGRRRRRRRAQARAGRRGRLMWTAASAARAREPARLARPSVPDKHGRRRRVRQLTYARARRRRAAVRARCSRTRASSAATASPCTWTTRLAARPRSSARCSRAASSRSSTRRRRPTSSPSSSTTARPSFLIAEGHVCARSPTTRRSAPRQGVYADGSRRAAPRLARAIASAPPEPRPVGTIPNDLASLIYTSGTTGRAEGRDA